MAYGKSIFVKFWAIKIGLPPACQLQWPWLTSASQIHIMQLASRVTISSVFMKEKLLRKKNFLSFGFSTKIKI